MSLAKRFNELRRGFHRTFWIAPLFIAAILAALTLLAGLSILGPVLRLFQSYLGAETSAKVGAHERRDSPLITL